MTENKTIPTKVSVTSFIKNIPNNELRKDCFKLIEMMHKASKLEPVMWGSSIVGFGTYHYKYESGREGDSIVIGFAPRKQNIAIYLMGGLKNIENLIPKLGKYKIGKGCLYVKTLAEVNTKVLAEIFTKSFKLAKRDTPRTVKK
jgi:Domain of unknown function (DU1801)